MNNKVAAIILGAGKGTRMKSDLPKVMMPVCGKSMIKHIIDTLEEMKVDEIVTLGLSFGDVDVPYLQRIMCEIKPQTKWYAYYYTPEDKERLKNVFGILGITRNYQVYFLHSDKFWDT